MPFEIGGEAPNDEAIKTMENARKRIGMSKPFSSAGGHMETLNADDQVSDGFLKEIQKLRVGAPLCAVLWGEENRFVIVFDRNRHP